MGAAPDGGDYVYLQSDPQNHLGAGRTYLYTLSNAAITATTRTVQLTIEVDGDEHWTGTLAAPYQLGVIERGYYSELHRPEPIAGVRGGIAWAHDSSGCADVDGWFAIDALKFAPGDPTDPTVSQTLTAVDLRFEQRCDGESAALHGQVHWTADDPTLPPGPATPVPASLWAPPPGATPTTGNYAYLVSDPMDWLGGGQTHLFTPANGGLSVTEDAGTLHVAVPNAARWRGVFAVMRGLDAFRVGYYAGLHMYPGNVAKGSLEWSGDARGCRSVAGWFAVDSVTYTDDRLTLIDLRFEQQCDGSEAALHGRIHWQVDASGGP